MKAKRKTVSRKASAKIRSKERLVFAFHKEDSLTGVSRGTVKKLAGAMGLSETRFLHLGAVELINKLQRRPQAKENILRQEAAYLYEPGKDHARVTDQQIGALRAMVPQDQQATSSFLDLLTEREHG
jgi:hypothetical protein